MTGNTVQKKFDPGTVPGFTIDNKNKQSNLEVFKDEKES